MFASLRFFICAIAICFCTTVGHAAGNSTVTRLGDLMQVIVPAYALGIAVNEHDTTGIEQFAYSFLATEAAVYGLKFAVQERRPDGSDNLSFPSGHTALTMFGASFIHNRYGLKRALIPYLMTGFTAYSRIDGMRHYWWDTLAGAAISGLISFAIVDRYQGVRILTHPSGMRFSVKF